MVRVPKIHTALETLPTYFTRRVEELDISETCTEVNDRLMLKILVPNEFESWCLVAVLLSVRNYEHVCGWIVLLSPDSVCEWRGRCIGV